MGDHAGEALGGLQEISAGDIEVTERLLPMYPLPGLPRVPFRAEEAARYAARFIGT